jgi:acyl-coenzyme A synthetase/AMP-(fatty) acid ligase
MLVTGSTLSPGYLGRDDLTAERFPTTALGGEERRWYRSGDLARRDGEGELRYLGRIDGQVNLRGFRIELGEVEAALRDDPAVADAAATVATMPGGERALVALVVVADDASAPSGTALRDLCRRRLPAYMVPDRVTVVDDVPTTPSGKVDRAAVSDIAARLATRSTRPRPERRAGR